MLGTFGPNVDGVAVPPRHPPTLRLLTLAYCGLPTTYSFFRHFNLTLRVFRRCSRLVVLAAHHSKVRVPALIFALYHLLPIADCPLPIARFIFTAPAPSDGPFNEIPSCETERLIADRSFPSLIPHNTYTHLLYNILYTALIPASPTTCLPACLPVFCKHNSAARLIPDRQTTGATLATLAPFPRLYTMIHLIAICSPEFSRRFEKSI